MKYEIEFLPVGNGEKSGDAIIIRYEDHNEFKIMVVDGGTKESGEEIVKHINEHYGVNHVDFVVNTHPDQDHASGLSVVMDKMEVSELWIHRPWLYTDEIIDYFKDQRMTKESLANRLKDKFSSAYTLEVIAKQKYIPIYEPYQGQNIGQFHVLSPGQQWYLHELIPQFNKTPEQKTTLGELLERLESVGRTIIESLDIETLGEDGDTSADNESSVILHGLINEKGILLTGDSGLKALNEAYEYYPGLPMKLNFIQIPHHGSRRNVSPSILDKLLGPKGQTENKTAFVSASREAKKHPRQSVVNAFIRRGCKVVSTEGSTIRHKHKMKDRDGWVTATPLVFKSEFEEEN